MKTMMKPFSANSSQNLLHHRIYWYHQLSGELPKTGILTDYLRPDRFNGRNKVMTFELDAHLAQTVIQLSQNSYLSIYILLLSAFSSLLKQYTRSNELIVGTPRYSSTDNNPASANQAIPLRLNLSDHLSFKDLLLHVKDTVIQTYTHQNYPLDELLSALEISQQPNRHTLYDMVILLENIHDYPADLNHDLTVSWRVSGNTIAGRIGYSDALYKEETIQALARHYVNAIQQIVKNPGINIADIVLLGDDETHQLLEQFNSNTKTYPIDQTIHSLFEAQVERSSSHIAAAYQGGYLTYQDLNAGANQLAQFLRDLGVKNGDFVGILQGRNLNFLQSILAILKAGGAYVPIDSTYPTERIQYMLLNSEVKVLLTDSSCLKPMGDRLEQCPHLKSVICLDLDSADRVETLSPELSVYARSNFSHYPTANLTTVTCGRDRAYMLYTSGSTGLPKGAIVRHDGAINHIYAQFDALKLSQELRFLQSAPASSDISVWQFLAPLLIGGRTVIVDTETVCDPEKLFQVIQTEQLTLVELVPVLLKGLMNFVSRLPVSQRSLPHLQWMMVTGESVSVQLINQWLNLYPAIPAVNAYGPTEAADDITQWIVEQPLPVNQRSVPIGKPLANIALYVLDAQLGLVPIGVPGEICVSGIGVGEGYWQNEAKTNLRFVPNPYAKPSTSYQNLIYKTGDSGRWLPDGTIEYLGRIDHQVKIRGFRIELGEIEAVISHHPAIREAVVIVREDQPGDKRLVAYGVADADANRADPHQLASDLREFLQSRLPDYMVPSAFVPIDRLPLTPSGKINRNALPEPDIKSPVQAESDAVISPVEELLVGIWSKVLGYDRVGIHDNFFELGGHSLLATLIISQVRQVFQREVPLRRLFELPTIAQFATAIETETQADLGLDIPPIERCSTETIPLSFAQQRLWFLAQLEPDNPFYNLPIAVALQGSLNLAALEQSFTEILRRHEVLRTKVTIVDEQPIAIVTSAIPIPFPVIDLSALPEPRQEAEVHSLIAAEGQQPFDLSRDLLLRVKLLRLRQDDHILLLTMHHSAADGWSIGVLVQEVSVLYQAFCQHQPSPLPALSIQYADFAIWQRQWLQGAVLDAQLSYWRKQLANAPTRLELPTDRPRPAIQSYRGATHHFQFSPELLRSLHHLSQQAGCTLFMTVLAAFKVLLGRYSGSEDIVVGTPIANRHRAEVENLIGCFVNTLVLRTNLSENPTVLELLEQVRSVALDAYAHQDLPFEQLVETLQPQRSLSHSPLFQIMVVLQNTPIPTVDLLGLQVNAIETDRGTAQFDLTLFLEETPEGLSGTIEYNADLFNSDTIDRMVGHYQTLLNAITQNPDQQISNLPLLTSAEQQQFWQLNQTQVNYPQTLCLHHLVEAQVQRTPDAIAVVFEDQQLTYQELNARANQLAHYLRTLAVGPDVLVGVCLERSLEMVIGLLGILKAGGAYVPIDPAYPQERLTFMLEDADVSLLLTHSKLLEILPSPRPQCICLDSHWDAISTHSPHNLDHPIAPANLAYVIYTSGSTGRPKGVMNTHAGIVNRLLWMQETYCLTTDDRVLQKTPFSFDVSVWEFFWSLSSGAQLVVAQPGGHRDSRYLVDLIVSAQITTLHFVPSMLQVFLQEPDLERCQSLRRIICSGEALTMALQQRCLSRLDAELHNLYGPTEAAIDVTFWHCQRQDQYENQRQSVPIGRPIANTQIHLLDAAGRPVPVGVVGELHIGGIGLARGYLKRPDLTAERFVPDPFSDKPGTRLYKTGDLARYLPNGEIEYIGRIDHQVKLRGFRIELGEIEAALSQHPQVRESVVMLSNDSAGEPRLVAYIVFDSETPASIRELQIRGLRGFLQEKLPDYMVPAVWVPLGALPLTASGKVDRVSVAEQHRVSVAEKYLVAFPETHPYSSRNDADFVSPRNATESLLNSIFVEVLGLKTISIHDNFFELGGHSLLATRVTSRLREEFQMELPLRSLFEKPTVAELAERIDTLRLSIEAANLETAIGDDRTEIEL